MVGAGLSSFAPPAVDQPKVTQVGSGPTQANPEAVGNSDNSSHIATGRLLPGELTPGSRIPNKGRPPPKPAYRATPSAGVPVATRSVEASAYPNSLRPSPTTSSGSRAHAQPTESARSSVLAAPRRVPARIGEQSPASPDRFASSDEPRSQSTSAVNFVASATASRAAETATEGGPSSSRRLGYARSESDKAHQRVASAVHPGAAKAPTVGKLPGVPETVASSLGNAVARPTATRPDPLAGAFTKAVIATSDLAAEPAHPLAGDEWYVGVNDQPIGPIRLAEIRDRAARGEVTAECLVWRDGFEDWKPLVAFPELVAVVEEGVASFRSLRPPPPPDLSTGDKPATVQVVAPIASQSAIAAPSVPHFNDDLLALAGVSKPKIPIAAWAAVLGALALGVTIGLVVIKPEAPKQVIKYVEVPASVKGAGAEAPPPASAANGDSNAQSTNGEAAAAADKRVGGTIRKVTATGVTDSAAATPPSEVAPQGLKGLQGLQGLGAPRTGPNTDVSAAAAGRQQLDSATLSRTVSRYTASVKRSCWQPALDTRAPDASTSARISANIVVAPSGKVQAVTVSPDPKGYRGLSTCIQGRVRNWEFPPAGGTTEFNVPFVFAAQ